jgi:hypothetical protein
LLAPGKKGIILLSLASLSANSLGNSARSVDDWWQFYDTTGKLKTWIIGREITESATDVCFGFFDENAIIAL